MNKKIVTIENNKKVEYDVIISFTANQNQKNYIAYTKNEKDENGNVKIFIATYEVDKNNNDLYNLKQIETQEEIDMFNEILEELKNNAK